MSIEDYKVRIGGIELIIRLSSLADKMKLMFSHFNQVSLSQTIFRTNTALAAPDMVLLFRFLKNNTRFSKILLGTIRPSKILATLRKI